ncbi:cation-translocating P-type ATPase [Candidatus Woesearchaeota archaeon]|nr:cation-translocating P-type ATPase [Candidatus Woesearchaeota archaeon]
MFHTKEVKTLLKEYNSTAKGISKADARYRLQKYGPNKLVKTQKISKIKILFTQFKDILVLILVLAAILSFFFGDGTDVAVIMAIVILNALIGFFQEYKAEKSLEALKNMITPTAVVLREGVQQEIKVEQLVPGDIIILNEGSKIPADARLIEVNEFRTQEAALTGESLPQKKFVKTISKLSTQVGDRDNMVFMGTSVSHGTAKALVVTTGMNTEFGQIASLTQDVKKELSPLQREMLHVGSITAKATAAVTIIVLIAGTLKALALGMPFMSAFSQVFLFAISLAVAAVPEGLPTTVTVALSIGVQKMAKKNAIIRKLSSVETLGATTVICSDKTGTLTKNEMTVKQLYANNKLIEVTGSGYDPAGDFLYKGKSLAPHELDEYHSLITIAALCNDAALSTPSAKKQGWDILGDPTEGALLVAAQKMKLHPQVLNKTYPRLHEIPFDSTKKVMTTIHQVDNKIMAYTKGAVDVVLKHCHHININGKTRKLTNKLRKQIINHNKEMAEQALRVLAIAYKETDKKYTNSQTDMILMGLIAMIDPPREEVKKAVAQCKKAGIKIRIITGDFGITAKAIARQVGIANYDTRIITGEELDHLGDDHLKKILKEEEVIFARVAPKHKLRIVTLFESLGEVVAVTGDGVNDAPALKKADIGIAMGVTGTDVAKESSNMVLADDSFASIVGAVEEGRRIYDNLKKFTLYVFSSNIGELLVVFFGIFMGFPLPLLAIQILAVDLGTDVLPSLALGVDPAADDVMGRKPRHKSERIMNKEFLKRLLFIGVIITVGTLFLFTKTLLAGGWKFGENLALDSPLYMRATTIALVSLIIFQLVNSFSSRTTKTSVFKAGLFSNKWLIGAVLMSLGLAIGLVHVPTLSKAFHTVPLTLMEWAWIFGASLSLLFFEEIRKLYLRVTS